MHKQHKKSVFLITLLVASLFLASQINLQNSKLVASGHVGTQVGGTITSNTTWTAANSPYIITDTIQIPENVNLTIEPGVTVNAQSSISTMFLINGIIQAHGTISNKIIFDGGNNANFFKTNHPVAKGFADLDFCIIRNGQSAFWFDNTGSFNMTNSELSNLSQSSYLWYPSQDVYIEFNSFTNTAGFKIGTDDYFSNSPGFVYVEDNLFVNNQGFIINNYASYGLSKTIVNNNSFTDTDGVILEVESGSTTADMDASQNFWGTTNTSIIDSMIYDKNDDASCASVINYLPLLDAPDPAAPVAPTPAPSPTPAPPPSSTPSPTILPTTNPDPSSSPNPSTAPGATPVPTTSPANLPAPDRTINPADPTANPTIDPSALSPSPNPSTASAVPEFPMTVVLLILFAASSTFVFMGIKKQKNR
jgi:hypothetical protein